MLSSSLVVQALVDCMNIRAICSRNLASFSMAGCRVNPSTDATAANVDQPPSTIAVRPHDTPAQGCIESPMQQDRLESADEYEEHGEQVAGFGKEEIDGDGAESTDDDQEDDDDHAAARDEHSRGDDQREASKETTTE